MVSNYYSYFFFHLITPFFFFLGCWWRWRRWLLELFFFVCFQSSQLLCIFRVIYILRYIY
jgi:hypothetical protein